MFISRTYIKCKKLKAAKRKADAETALHEVQLRRRDLVSSEMSFTVEILLCVQFQ
jgi:t-SNARE complex subunit (syntaxin)